MKENNALCVALGLCVVGCTETLSVSGDAAKPSEYNRSSYTSPVIVSLDSLNIDQRNDVVAINNTEGVVISDANATFDQTVVNRNQGIKSRAAGTSGNVAIKTTGESRLSKRTYFMLGEVSEYHLYDYDLTSGLRIKNTEYNSSGVDLTWFTEDDDVAHYATFGATVNGIDTLVAKYSGAGPDATWFTDDDAVHRYQTVLLDANGAAIGEANYHAPGLDGLWFTDDDVIMAVYAESTAADGNLRWMLYNSAGLDADWATLEDNGIGHFSLTTLNADANKERHVFYLDPGVDLIPYNTDDTVMYYHDYAYDAQSQFTSSILYNGPGVDLEWFTADDVPKVCKTVTYNADNTIDQEVRTAPGIDLTCFTADDVTQSYDVHIYNDTSHLTTGNRFTGQGVDLEWFTTDDVLTRENVFEPL